MTEDRVYNFSAGPSIMPEPVLQRARAELMNYRGSGMSVMEMSHRSPAFTEIFTDTKEKFRSILHIPESHEILFLQGGATLQFAAIPMNLMEGETADFQEITWADSIRYNWGNGDGRFLYPPRACFDKGEGPILEPPNGSMRLEILRDGIEDYEYFAILSRLDPGNALLEVPSDVSKSQTDFTRRPAPIKAHRLKLAREIERLFNVTTNATDHENHD